MSYKYLGEAVALLGIAYSIVRWLARNAPDADAPRALVTIELGSPGLLREAEATDAPSVSSDPRTLEAAAAAFGITPEALAGMDGRERALLLATYAAATRPPR